MSCLVQFGCVYMYIVCGVFPLFTVWRFRWLDHFLHKISDIKKTQHIANISICTITKSECNQITAWAYVWTVTSAELLTISLVGFFNLFLFRSSVCVSVWFGEAEFIIHTRTFFHNSYKQCSSCVCLTGETHRGRKSIWSGFRLHNVLSTFFFSPVLDIVCKYTAVLLRLLSWHSHTHMGQYRYFQMIADDKAPVHTRI